MHGISSESVKAHALRDLIPALLSEYNVSSAPSACQCDWNDFTEGKEQNDTDIHRIHLHIISL